MVVQRLTVDEKILTASEHFEDDSALPLPAQMFRFDAEEVMDNTEDFSYSLLSLNPINKKNGPGSSSWHYDGDRTARAPWEKRPSATIRDEVHCSRSPPGLSTLH